MDGCDDEVRLLHEMNRIHKQNHRTDRWTQTFKHAKCFRQLCIWAHILSTQNHYNQLSCSSDLPSADFNTRERRREERENYSSWITADQQSEPLCRTGSLTCSLASYQVLALWFVGVDGRDCHHVLCVRVQVLWSVGSLVTVQDLLVMDIWIQHESLISHNALLHMWCCF